ncbi:hypothetical protein BZG36_04414 [Bifiguratus adelaidae]|uniref:Cytochrome P450 n=1 Tax=Bifiguratus adelaidae TaxID=1938954 RepID=A0A261XWC3_9FUNG|nr:hypothetical protein BZG36_04414 [Bifiguratus adelaidae]
MLGFNISGLAMATISAAAAAPFLVTRAAKRTENCNLPPSIPGSLPLLGNLLQLGTSPHKRFTEWSKTFGPIFTFRAGACLWVVLNDLDTMKDLIITRGAKYSSRNMNEIIQIATGDGRVFAAGPNDARWKKFRRVATLALTKAKVNEYQAIIDLQSKRFLKLLHDAHQRSTKGIELKEYFTFYTLSTIVSIAFGKQITNIDDPELQEQQFIMDRFMQIAGVGSQILEFFPFLKYTPFNQDIGSAYEFRAHVEASWCRLVNETRLHLVTGQWHPSFMSNLLQSPEAEGLSDLDLAYLGGLIVGAGFESTALSMEWLCAVLVNYPWVQERIFQELDAVVGRDRLPELADFDKLPYLQSTMHEIWRFRTPGWLAIPHCTTEDDEYRGYFIPKGTTVLINLHAIHMDPDTYAEPEVFMPERHLEAVTAFLEHGQHIAFGDVPHWAFGSGRRACIGQLLAEREVLTGISRFLWAFRLEHVNDANGANTPIDIDSTIFGLASAPKPYRVALVLRDPSSLSVLEAFCDTA